VAAWLWERGMAIERHRIRGTGRINWRLTPERLLVRIGLAEVSDRTTSEVDAHRRLTRVALAIKKVRALQQRGASKRKLRLALAKLDKAMDKAVEHAGVASDEARQQALLERIDALYSTDALVQRKKVARWADPTTQEEKERALTAIDEAARFDTAEATQRALDKAALTLMALTERVTSDVTSQRVTHEDTSHVTTEVPAAAIPAPRDRRSLTSTTTDEMTPAMTVERVTTGVMFDVTDGAVYDLERMLSGDQIMTSFVTPIEAPTDVTTDGTDDADEATKAKVMRAFWESEIKEKRFPKPIELARHADADPAHASRLRARWVEELTGWDKRRAKSALRDKASA
jgi:hypothetical protein